MSSDDPRMADWLRDIVDNALAAESYVQGLTLEQFREDRMRIDAVELRTRKRCRQAAPKPYKWT